MLSIVKRVGALTVSRVISVSNHKGGVGKTTISANLAFAMARRYKVLLIDLDPQTNLSKGLGFFDTNESIGDYIKQVIHFRLPELKPQAINNYVHIIPATANLLEIDKLLHDTVRGDNVLKELIYPLTHHYDLIMIDCPTAFNYLTINALNCSNLILIPSKAEKFSVDGIEMIKSYALQHNIPFKIVFNLVNGRLRLHKNTIKAAEESMKEVVLHARIRNTVVLSEAFSHAKDIFHYNVESKAADDFIKLSDELMDFI